MSDHIASPPPASPESSESDNEQLQQLRARAKPKGTAGGEQWAISLYDKWAVDNGKRSFEYLQTVCTQRKASLLLQKWFSGCTQGIRGKQLDIDSKRVLFHNMARLLNEKKEIGS